AGRLRLSDIRRARRLDVVWTRSLRLISALSVLCRSHLEGSQAGRSSRSATNEVRTGHQSQDCEGAGPRNSAYAARPRRRGDRISTRQRSYLIFGDIEGKLDVLRVECSKVQSQGPLSAAQADCEIRPSRQPNEMEGAAQRVLAAALPG